MVYCWWCSVGGGVAGGSAADVGGAAADVADVGGGVAVLVVTLLYDQQNQ